MIREREEEWAAKGLRLYRPPAYRAHPNLIESTHGAPSKVSCGRDASMIRLGELKQAVFCTP
jgi:hypothetical protein